MQLQMVNRQMVQMIRETCSSHQGVIFCRPPKLLGFGQPEGGFIRIGRKVIPSFFRFLFALALCLAMLMPPSKQSLWKLKWFLWRITQNDILLLRTKAGLFKCRALVWRVHVWEPPCLPTRLTFFKRRAGEKGIRAWKEAPSSLEQMLFDV